MGALSRTNDRQKDCRSAARNPRWLNLAAGVWETFITASVFWMILSADVFGRAVVDTVFALSLWQKHTHTHTHALVQVLTPPHLHAHSSGFRSEPQKQTCALQLQARPEWQAKSVFAAANYLIRTHVWFLRRPLSACYKENASKLQLRNNSAEIGIWTSLVEAAKTLGEHFSLSIWGGKPNATIHLWWFLTSSLIQPGNLWFHISSHICLFFFLFLKSCVCHWNSG